MFLRPFTLTNRRSFFMSPKPSSPKKPAAPSSGGKWGDLVVRVMSAVALLCVQVAVIAAGSTALTVEMIVLVYLAFREFVNIDRLPKLGLFFRVFPYLFVTLILYAIGAPVFFEAFNVHPTVALKHGLICYGIGALLMILFVVNLREDNWTAAFSRLGWTLVGSMVVVIPGVLYCKVIQLSLFWFVTTASLVVWNDTWAYFCGRLFGRHPLIALSPKKTMEGFFGALILCVIIGFYQPLIFANLPFMYCPSVRPFDFGVECEIPDLFVLRQYEVNGYRFKCYPAQIHSAVLALFASIVAPFGGFLASGLKRRFGIKDFGTLIPGHGGVLDRIDCQLVMGSFAILYIEAFASQ